MSKFDQLVAALSSVNEAKIPVMSNDRCIPWKMQAILARQLFKELGVKRGLISVTTPNYANASCVYVTMPKPEVDVAITDSGAVNLHWLEARERMEKLSLKVKEIIARAFPRHDDRSEYGTDYYDFCWLFKFECGTMA
tara:strand:- start:3902 stop:4315 length:414 start_codon:yes stop_codon:yes gene_type:complete